MWFFTCFVCVSWLILNVVFATDQNCLCVTGSTKKIYTSPDVTREEIGLAIRGECLPVAHTNDENDAWVAVDFVKNIIFHQLHLIGYMARDSGVVYRQCTGGQEIAFLTTTESYITYNPTTEITTTEETLTTASASASPETTLMSTLKPTSDVISGRVTTPITDGATVFSTTESVTLPPTTEPDTMPPTKEQGTFPPSTEPDTMPPTKEQGTLPPSTEPDTMPPTKATDTMPPTKELVTLNEFTSRATSIKDVSPTTSSMMPTTNSASSWMTVEFTSIEPVSSTSHSIVNSEVTTASKTTSNKTTVLPLPQSTITKQNTAMETTWHGSTAITKPTEVYLTSNTDTMTSEITKEASYSAETTTIFVSPSTMKANTNTTDTSWGLTCMNGGICITEPFESCLCTGAWTGVSCDMCSGTTCYQGDCFMIGATPKCVCSPGFTGESCNETQVCNSSEISIGGKCYTFNYVYETCQENYCINQPGTECLVNSEGIYCLCKDEFNPTDSTPCGCPAGYVRHLNGTCVEIDCRGVSTCSHGTCYFRSFYNFGCLCDEGWHGENCDLAVTQCGDHLCNNNGTCVQDPDAMCHCADAWTGPECDMCGLQTCHHGVCILDRYQQPMCVCDKEYGGLNCDQVVQCSGQQFGGHCYGNELQNFAPCIENVCQSGQLCVAALHTFKNDLYCVCKENATAAYLTTDCGCPERSLRNYRGECVDILLKS